MTESIIKLIMCLVTGYMLAYAYRYIKSGYKNKTFESTMDLICGAMLLIASVIIACILLSTNTNAQNVVRKGNTFTQVRVKNQPKDTFSITPYTYTTLDGVKYPVYVSKKGKYFIIRTSKNGNKYRQYLKNVQKQLEEEKLCTKQQNQQKK